MSQVDDANDGYEELVQAYKKFYKAATTVPVPESERISYYQNKLSALKEE